MDEATNALINDGTTGNKVCIGFDSGGLDNGACDWKLAGPIIGLAE